MTTTAYEYVNEAAIADHLKCDHCSRPFIAPMSVSCEHRFCRHCIESFDSVDQSCPKCRQAIQTLTPIVDPAMIDSLNYLLVKCPTCSKKNIPRDFLDEHLENHRLNALCHEQEQKIKGLKKFLKAIKAERMMNEKCESADLKELSSSPSTDQAIEEMLDQCSTGSKIDLLGRQLGDRAMQLVAKRIGQDNGCKILDIGGNQLTSQGASIIGNVLAESKCLASLYFGGNQLGDEGARCLARSMNQCKLIVLGLSENGLTDVGAGYLANMLKTNHHLTVLGLEDNDIGDAGVAQLAKGLEENSRLVRLLLARNKRITDSSLQALIDLLNNNQSLQRIDLRGCSLSDTAKAQLRQVASRKSKFDLWLD